MKAYADGGGIMNTFNIYEEKMESQKSNSKEEERKEEDDVFP